MSALFDDKTKQYPPAAKQKIAELKALIYQVAAEDNLGKVIESLKWNELSYLCKQGSAVRIDWKIKHPEFVSLFFNCQSLLIETFRELYPDSFEFIGNREIRLPIDQPLSNHQLKAA
ncbi:DUF1801 domain-containing protein [Catenovulum sp. 2E275]|uniref:DUF1801 domain-containing protein n=1 Tax=Catenovulum sp. 2E275 TaxID=2980497 RepID=UPI0021CF48FC|nr:DUF1801 domain-containing protein [Catenovulum sp. 2E275]MCU4674240.1 DUF1801 domain-containing protein [Catenovulum sp. 2E275]